jgi:hypothetical protein
MTMEVEFWRKLRDSPPHQQKETLHFVTFLKGKRGGKKPRRNLCGSWKHLHIGITEKDIAIGPPKMWGNLPRDIS